MKKKYYVVYDLVEAAPWYKIVVGDIPEEDWSRYMIAEISEGSYNIIRLINKLRDTLPCEKWYIIVELENKAGRLVFDDERECKAMAFPVLSFRDARFPDKLFDFNNQFNLNEAMNWDDGEFYIDWLAPEADDFVKTKGYIEDDKEEF